MKLLDLQRDPRAFREALLIDTDQGPKPLAEVMDPWQKADFEALDDGWRRAVIGAKVKAQYQRGWLERPRGHSKTQDIATMAAWALFASRRRISGIAAAGDQDQGRLLRDAIGRLCYLNPWLAKLIEVHAYHVRNTHTQSTLEIITSDAPTSYGALSDFIICDEITNWRKRDLWDSVLSTTAKRGTAFLVIITNAGFQDSWQFQTREAIRTDPSWYFSRQDGPVARWISETQLAEQRRLLPPTAFDRLWLNVWATAGGDALDAEAIAHAFREHLTPQTKAQPGFDYVAGLDLGVSRDASGLCVLGVRRNAEGHGLIRLAATKVWRPTAHAKVDLQQVEAYIVATHEQFGLKQLNYDPWQAMHMASRLQSLGMGKMVTGGNRKTALPMVEVSPSGKNLQAIATAVIEAFNDHRVELYDDPELRRDLNRLRVEERQYGFRLTSPRDELGHGDLGTAFCLAMLAASELAARRVMRAGTFADDRSPYQRALDRFAHDQEQYTQEMQRLANPLLSEDQEGLLQAIVQLGGIRRLV